MYARLKRLAPPQLRRVPKELNQCANAPKYAQAKANLFPQLRVEQVAGRKKAQQPHQHHRQRDEKSMHHHHLPVDKAQRAQLAPPSKITGENDMHQR
jgi:hypothetical protein